ncbi:TPA: regulator [Escherichia coli]|nr:regulator [Escherichia coli]HCI3154615.1 regulator [Escherichia coli]HCI7220808.1 regulator [Escherichia coli]
MDKELPWLADNAQLELKYKKGKTPLSHRNWPGEPVPVITENIIQTLGDELLQQAEKKKTLSGVMTTFHWSGSPPSRRPST